MAGTSKASKAVEPVVVGTVPEGMEGGPSKADEVVFIAPSKAAERQAASTANVSLIREHAATDNKRSQRLLALLVRSLVLDPTTGTDSNGKPTDCLTALGKGQGSVKVDSRMLSYARAAHLLVDTAAITSTSDERWTVALTAAHRLGIGRDRISKRLDTRSSKNARRGLAERILSEAAAVKGDARETSLKEAFPSARVDDGVTGTVTYRAAARAVEALIKAATVKPDDKGMTADERATVAADLARVIERLGQPA